MVIALALAAAGCYALASVLQHRQAMAAPPEHFMRLRLLVHLAQRPLWLIGIIADVGGYLLQALALGLGSLVVVQPLLVCGMLFSLPISAALSRRRLSWTDWGAALAVVVGLVVFLLMGDPGAGRANASGGRWLASGGAVLVLTASVVLVAHGASRHRRALLLGTAAGALYGFTAALTRTTVVDLGHGVIVALGTWKPYVLVAAGGLGLLLAQSAFHCSELSASLPALIVMDPVVSAALGISLFGETIQLQGLRGPAVALSAALMVAGVVALAHSPLVLGDPVVSSNVLSPDVPSG